MYRLRFTRVRDVKTPSRGNSGDAGLDFYVPVDLRVKDLTFSTTDKVEVNYKDINGDLSEIVDSISLPPHARVLIPTGIRVLIEPKDSMLMAANKSGIATKRGLIYTAEIVDSPYTGEIHIGILNTSDHTCTIHAGDKIMQFIHIPIIPTEPEEISQNEYEELAESWGTRGSNGFGSTDNK